MFSLFALTSLQSCNKEKQFEGTSWESSSFNISETYFDFWLEELVTVNYKMTVNVSFNKNNDADIIVKLSYIDPRTELPANNVITGRATYSYEKKEMVINVKWTAENMYSIDGGHWTGTVSGTSMALKNVFNQNLTFTKK